MNHEIIKSEFESLDPNFFNSAYFGPSPRSAQEIGKNYIARAANPVDFPYEEWRTVPDTIRDKIGKLLGVSGEQISHHTSLSEITSYIALGFPFQAGDQVVLMDGDYPSDVLPWMLNEERMGYEIVMLERDLFRDPSKLLEAMPKNAKLLNLSHVMFNTGLRFDIEAIGKLCRERGILFVCDVTQSFGGMPITAAQVAAIDIICCSSYKWMLGPYGHAFCYWSEAALEKIANVHLSWQSFIHSKSGNSLLNYSIEALPGARRFDRGQAPNLIAMHMLGASVDLLHEQGLASIAEHNQALLQQFLDNYPSECFEMQTPVGEHANILCLKLKTGDPHLLQEKLSEAKIDITVREGNLRLSFHLFNDSEQVDYLLRVLKAALQA